VAAHVEETMIWQWDPPVSPLKIFKKEKNI
jgi:hypothetical protein